MDDLAACADLCESHGFPAPAAALRALAEGKAPFYLVRARMDPDGAEFWNLDPAVACPPGRRVFRDRAMAERCAHALTAAALRTFRPDRRHFPPTQNYRLKSPYGPRVEPGDRFIEQVGAILGSPYELPAAGSPAFPVGATDEQLGRIGELLDFMLFDVAEIGPGPAPRDPIF